MANDYSFEKVSFDTKLFGFSVAKIIHINPNGAQKELSIRIRSLIKELQKQSILYVMYRFPANLFPLIHSLEENGFVLIDSMLNMRLTISQKYSLKNVSIRKAKKTDCKKAVKLANSFTSTRFFNDPYISKESAIRLYQKWIENSFDKKAADEVFIYEYSNEIAGLISVTKKGHIPLVAVGNQIQNKGIGKALLSFALNWFYFNNLKHAFIETQITNIPAVNLYIKMGFNITDSSVTYRLLV